MEKTLTYWCYGVPWEENDVWKEIVTILQCVCALVEWTRLVPLSMACE